MAWIEKKDWFKTAHDGGNGKKPGRVEQSYSVSEVATILNVSRQTVFNYLSFDEPEKAKIPPEGWYRLPSGHIRIFKSSVAKLQWGQ
jgi:hypothetical protein